MNKILLFLSSYHVACLVNNKLPSILLEYCIYLMQQKVVQKDRTFLCTWTLHKTKKGFMMLAEAAESRSSNRSSEFSLFFSLKDKCWPLCGIFKKEKLPQGGSGGVGEGVRESSRTGWLHTTDTQLTYTTTEDRMMNKCAAVLPWCCSEGHCKNFCATSMTAFAIRTEALI